VTNAGNWCKASGISGPVQETGAKQAGPVDQRRKLVQNKPDQWTSAGNWCETNRTSEGNWCKTSRTSGPVKETGAKPAGSVDQCRKLVRNEPDQWTSAGIWCKTSGISGPVQETGAKPAGPVDQ